jgi:hypothetical protein
MPTAQVMVTRLNHLFAPETICNLMPSWFSGELTSSDLTDIKTSVTPGSVPRDLTFITALNPGPVTLGVLARVFAVADDDFQQGVIDSVPGGMRQSLLAFIHHNLSQNPRLSMTWAWAPGYDYEVSLWECPGTKVSPGGITILLRTRYPLDPHPSGF